MQTLHWRNRLKRELAESTVGVRRRRRRYRRRPFSLLFVIDANRQTIFESVCPDGGRQQFSRTQNDKKQWQMWARLGVVARHGMRMLPLSIGTPLF